MKRLDFIKTGLLTILFSSIPFKSLSKVKSKSFGFNDIFKVWEKNDILVYFNKDHEIYKYLKNSIKDRLLDESLFWAYMPARDVYIPVKENYTIHDFEPLKLFLTSKYQWNRYYCEFQQGVFIRLIRDEKDRMYVDMFTAQKR